MKRKKLARFVLTEDEVNENGSRGLDQRESSGLAFVSIRSSMPRASIDSGKFSKRD